jgi:hypothetical protein
VNPKNEIAYYLTSNPKAFLGQAVCMVSSFELEPKVFYCEYYVYFFGTQKHEPFSGRIRFDTNTIPDGLIKVNQSLMIKEGIDQIKNKISSFLIDIIEKKSITDMSYIDFDLNGVDVAYLRVLWVGNLVGKEWLDFVLTNSKSEILKKEIQLMLSLPKMETT